MTTVHDLIDSVKSGWRTPDVVANRCVHSRLEVATCSKCVDCCPRDAWVMDDEQLGIDVDACDRCGLCMAVCPEAAIVQPLDLEIRQYEGESIAFAACELSGVVNGDGLIPCLHAISTRILIDLYNRGVRRLLLAQGDCATCERGSAESLSHRVSEFNRLLTDRDMTTLPLVVLPHEHWIGTRVAVNQGIDHDDPMSRRDFFRKVVVTAAQHQNNVTDEEVTFAESPGRLFPRQSFGELTLFAPDIDAEKCEGCDACARVCEYGAIRLSDNGDSYDIDADGCTGCGLCVDICEVTAVSVETWGRQRIVGVSLGQYHCSACGAPFRQPFNTGDVAPALCRICALTGHFKQLHQVLE